MPAPAGPTRVAGAIVASGISTSPHMGEIAYVSEVRIERIRGPARLAYLPSETAPVHFGVHGAVARHYGVSPEVSEPHAATLDYVVAAAGG